MFIFKEEKINFQALQNAYKQAKQGAVAAGL